MVNKMSAFFMINLMDEHDLRCLVKRDAAVRRTETLFSWSLYSKKIDFF